MQTLKVDHSQLFEPAQSEKMIEEFWQWSCHIYQNKEVANLCLAVQDTLDLNVNHLLLALWSQQKGLLIDESLWQNIEQESQQAMDAVLYIRQKRLQLKQKSPDAYQQALLIELKAEQQHQRQALQTICKQQSLFIDKNQPLNNLSHYLQVKGISARDQDTLQQLGQLVQNISL